ncbi:MAG: MucB/RseB C-terminal domain-containing protein [Gammaproteobacteria bacterium]|nr:MucB/RseB C-terminal domain-containing protein [Gammaproteobacteria bacterium]
MMRSVCSGEAQRLSRLVQYVLCFLLVLTLAASFQATASTSSEWLQRMSKAARTVNYQGTFVHMCAGEMDVIQVVHRVDTAGITERITAKSMGGRQVIRSDDEAMCIMPDQQMVVVEKGGRLSARHAALDRFSAFKNINAALYDVSLNGVDQVAEHETTMLVITPRDNARYGYRLWLDQQTALPLKFELVDENGNGLEQGMFTEITFPAKISANDVKPTIDTEQFAWQQTDVAGEISKADVGRWHPQQLPPGFVLVFAESKMPEGSESPMEQLVYSDGLATISIFAERATEGEVVAEGPSNLGATNTWSTTKEGWMVTAMGSVPARTIELVAGSIASGSIAAGSAR